jgi:hypothetical protein
MDSTRASSGDSGNVPEAGVFSIKRWAEFFESTEPSVRRWVKKYKVPFFKPGDTMFIKAVDFLKRIPYHDMEELDEDDPLEE